MVRHKNDPEGNLLRFSLSPMSVSQYLLQIIQSGASSLAKHGGAYFSAVYGSVQDPIAAPGPYENQEP